MSLAAYNRYWLLNSINGWRKGAPLKELLQRGDGVLTLQTLPGEAQPFLPDLVGIVAWPAALVVDDCGQIWLLDTGADRRVRVERVGLTGAWLATLRAGLLTDRAELAVGPTGIVAVVDGASRGGGIVQLLAADGSVATALPGLEQPRTAVFDDDGNLYVGTAKGLVFHFAPDADRPGAFVKVGVGVSGLDAPAVAMTWVAGKGLLGIFRHSGEPGRRLWWIPTDGAFVAGGHFITEVIDSGIEECPWDRVTLVGMIPEGSNVKVEYFTAADPADLKITPEKDTPDPNPNDGPPFTFVGEPTSPTGPNATAEHLTCLVQALPGQFLRLRITFRSGGPSTPALAAVKVFFPRQSYLQYLPAVYQEDPESRDFLDRFLSIFQATFDAFDATIDSMWRLFDPASVPPQFFDWLAAWLQFPTDPTWAPATKRTILKRAVKD